MTTTEPVLPADATNLAAQALADQFGGRIEMRASGTWNSGRAVVVLPSGQALEVVVTESY